MLYHYQNLNKHHYIIIKSYKILFFLLKYNYFSVIICLITSLFTLQYFGSLYYWFSANKRSKRQMFIITSSSETNINISS